MLYGKFASFTSTIFQLLGWFHSKAPPSFPFLVNSTLVFTSHLVYLMFLESTTHIHLATRHFVLQNAPKQGKRVWWEFAFCNFSNPLLPP
jgi:hypothetical protein